MGAQADRHGNPSFSVRPPPGVKEPAREALEAHGWEMNEFLAACMILVAQDPVSMLAMLTKHRPPRKRGRPRKKDNDQ